MIVELFYVLIVIVLIIITIFKIKNKINKIFIIFVIIIPVIPILLIIGAIVKTEYRKEFLKQININEDIIMVENCELNNSGFIINELRKVAPYIKHHSSAINHIELKF